MCAVYNRAEISGHFTAAVFELVTSPPDILPVAAAALCTAYSSHLARPSAHESVSCKGSKDKNSLGFS